MIFFSLMAAGCLRIIVIFGQEYVDKPRLVPYVPRIGDKKNDTLSLTKSDMKKKKDDDLYLSKKL